jgi:hypothetical protein
MAGKAELVGVYALPVDDALVVAQSRELYGENPRPAQIDQVREQLNSAVLVEVAISNAGASFDVGDFVLEDPTLPRDNWQAAWAEAFLTTDGERLLVKRWGSLPKDQQNFRVAFYIHNWKLGGRLLSSYGPIPTTAPLPMPDRLKRLVPYVEVD